MNTLLVSPYITQIVTMGVFSAKSAKLEFGKFYELALASVHKKVDNRNFILLSQQKLFHDHHGHPVHTIQLEQRGHVSFCLFQRGYFEAVQCRENPPPLGPRLPSIEGPEWPGKRWKRGRERSDGGLHGRRQEKDPRVADGRRARDVQGGLHRLRQEPGRHHHHQGTTPTHASCGPNEAFGRANMALLPLSPTNQSRLSALNLLGPLTRFMAAIARPCFVFV